MDDNSTKWRNPIRAKLEAGETAIAVTITTNNLETTALAAGLGFDFLWIEMEHSPITLETLRAVVLTTRGLPTPVFARVPVAELWTAKRVLDQGVSGVIFPFCSTPELARRAADACRYPPAGLRGSGAGLATATWPDRADYYDSADRNVFVIAMIEQKEAIDHVESIAATPGIDALFIGTSDLSFSYGFRGEQNRPELRDAIAKVVAAGKRHGKYLGRPAASPEQIPMFRDMGFQLFQGMTELGLMRLGARKYFEPLGTSDTPQEKRALY